MATVELTEIPEPGDDLEDFVAALYQSAGYFVEKSLQERAPDEVLELDLVATYYSPKSSAAVLAEVKGGGWGYPDVFKVVGWMNYLDQKQGAFFFRSSNKANLAAMSSRMEAIGLKLIELHDFTRAEDIFEQAGMGQVAAPELVSLWRHSYQIHRRLVKLVHQRSKTAGDAEGPKAAFEYQRLINDGTFFARSPLDSLSMLYAAYKEHPRLTLSCASEIAGDKFDPYTPTQAGALLINEAFLEGKHAFLQACMFLEQRARLAILKAAVDYVIQAGDTGEPTGWGALVLQSLPKTFHDGLSWLRSQPTMERYPVLWQQFLWGWGGFYLSGREEQEFDWMSRYSGVPKHEVPSALEAFDKFFPPGMGGSWLRTPGWTEVKVTVLTPMIYEGLGAHHRRQQYALEGFGGLGSGYTGSDLVKWNNCTVEFLLPRE